MQSRIKSNTVWFKDAVIYELSVRSFCDGNGDGIGDFQGLISKLDYLEDLGVNTIWLLPFFPSPLKDDGFDVTDYCDIHPEYGTLSDFKQFLKGAHQRGIRVITELVLNHTSDQHPWFQRSRKARPGSRYRDYYVWSTSTEKYQEARVLLSVNHDNWAWDTGAKAYYWHRFSRHQPELNYDNPEVQLEIIKVIDFWMKMGIDGFRLPSVAFLFEEEGTTCENLPQTHDFLKKIRAHLDKHYPEKVLMAEVNQWPEDSAAYFGKGKECNMCLNFSLMPRLFLALRTEDSYPIIDILEQTPTAPENSQWALFLRNHDEIGLEMVTEEEKDYLFRAYANDPHMKHNVGIRRRLAPLLNNDRRKIELLYSLLFSLPGTPIIYYGDEIGMGDNIYLGDRYGVRTPMQWNMNLNAGFSTANPQRLVLPIVSDPVYRYESVNVAMQQENPSSLISWIKNVLSMRRRLRILSQGDLNFIESTNARVLCYSRGFENQKIVVIANLSQFSQMTSLDFSEFKGSNITELFSQNRFSSVATRNYPITLGPYGYYWLQLDAPEKNDSGSSSELPLYRSELSWERTFSNQENVQFMERKVLPRFIRKSRWFGSKLRAINKVVVDKILPLKTSERMHYFLIVEVHFVQKLPELYSLPVSFALADAVFETGEYNSQSIICRADFQGKAGFLIDSVYDRDFRDFVFHAMERKTKVREDAGSIEFSSGTYVKFDSKEVDSKILNDERSNPAVIYNDHFFFKLYRKVEPEPNPDVEIVRFLSDNTRFKHSPRYAGSIDFIDNEGRVTTLGMLQEKIESQGDSWTMATDSVGRFYERVLADTRRENIPKLINRSSIGFEEAPELVQELMGRGFYERVIRLGQRTAEMHLALASDNSRPDFAPENFTANYQRSAYSSLRKLTRDCLKLLKQSIDRLDSSTQTLAKEVLSKQDQILACFSEIQGVGMNFIRTRIHGDFHLGQVLFTGKDFVINNFEGEADVSFTEQRLKKSPLKDVASMLRSFHYAAFGKILLNENYREKDAEILSQWAELWQHFAGRFYLGAYLEKLGQNKELSKAEDTLMHIFLMEKALEELGHELNNRMHWVVVPLKGILYQLSRWQQSKTNGQKS